MEHYKLETFNCGECGWVGPGYDCKSVDRLKDAMIIGCPNCDIPLRTVPAATLATA